MKVYVFLANGFEEMEVAYPVSILRAAGFDVVTVSIMDTEKVIGSHGVSIIADATYGEINAFDADAIILPGGQPGTDLYRYFERKPEFESAQGAFRVTLYNMNCAFEQSETDLERIKQNEDERNRIIDAVRESGSITRKDVEILLGAGQTKAYSILNELVMNGQLVRIRAGKKTIYQLAE